MKHSEQSATGHCQTKNRNHSHLKSAINQSILFRSLYQQYQTSCNDSVHKISIHQNNNSKKSRKETKGFKGGFIPPELKSTEPTGRKESTQSWLCSSDREESLSDLPRRERKETLT